MAEICFLHYHTPMPEAACAVPSTVPIASAATREKTVVLFHDESTFQANEDQPVMWGKKGEHLLYDAWNGYHALRDEYSRAKQANPNITKQARKIMEYGESRKGYCTCEAF